MTLAHIIASLFWAAVLVLALGVTTGLLIPALPAIRAALRGRRD